MATGLGDAHTKVALASILEDARFVVRTAYAIIRSPKQQQAVVSMALLPSFGVVTHESRKWLIQHLPDVANQLPDEELELVADIRNASKWFDASREGQSGAIRRFEELVAAHADEFLDNTPYAWARNLESDLGLYLHGNDVALNTHLIGTMLGKDALERGPVVRQMATTMTRQAFKLSGENVAPAPSFVDELRPLMNRNVRSTRYYGKTGLNLAESGYLHLIWSTLAFLNLMSPAVTDDDASVFKLQYIGLFHATKTVRRLLPDLAPSSNLTDGDAARQLRNDLIHYTPHHTYPSAALDPQRPRQALVEHAYTDSFPQVAAQTAAEVTELHERLRGRLGH